MGVDNGVGMRYGGGEGGRVMSLRDWIPAVYLGMVLLSQLVGIAKPSNAETTGVHRAVGAGIVMTVLTAFLVTR